MSFGLMLTACSEVESTGTITSGTTSFTIIKIGDCEYVSYNLGRENGCITHKGDCSNPIHYCNCK
jgi:hypothetical protein